MAASTLCLPECSDRRFRPCRKGPAFRRVATPPQARAGEAAGEDIAYHLSGSYVSACDLSSALGRAPSPLSPVVVAGLQTRQRDGREHPVSSRGQRGICFSPLYLGQTLVQKLHLAQPQYINAYGTNSWRETIRTSHEQSADHISPDPQSPPPQPAPAPTPAEASDAPPASEQDCIHPSLLASCVTGQHRVYPYSGQWPLMVPANFPIFGVASQKRVGLPESTSRG